MISKVFVNVLVVAAGSDARQSCASNTQACKADMTSDDAALLQADVRKHIIKAASPDEGSALASFEEWHSGKWCPSKYGEEIGPEEALAQACLDDHDCQGIWWVPGWNAGKKCAEASFGGTQYSDQKVAAKHHDTFTTPHDLMADACAGDVVMTTSCMTGEMYDEVVGAINNTLFVELDQTCNGESCQVADWAGCVLRMCGHDFMDFHDGEGGADACTDMNEPDNAGLSACLAAGEFGHSLKGLYGSFCTRMSLADFEVIAAQAVMSLLATEGQPKETLSTGLKTNFLYGRTTAIGETCRGVTHAEGSLILPNPALGCNETERVFVNNMGLTWEEATALMGVHSLGRASTSNSGYDGYWMSPENAKKFNNEYFTALIAVSWCPELNVGGNPNKHQWKRCDDGSEKFYWKEMMLNTDMCLAYADKNGGSLIASPDHPDSNCCAWVHSFVEDYNMTDVIANNGHSFCNKACSDYASGECGSHDNKYEEFKLCCKFEPKTPKRADCHTPGLGKAKFWTEASQNSAPGAEYVRRFAASRLEWINVFLVAWKKSTENGFAALHALEGTCGY